MGSARSVLWPCLALCAQALMAAGTDDQVIQQARGLLYHDRNKALLILEDAVRREPQRPKLWAELIYGLDVDGQYYFAERASRTALRLHPAHPRLLVARARVLEPSPALEVLARLEKVKGHEEEARQLQELVRLGLGVPNPSLDGARALEAWAGGWFDRLLITGRRERAREVITEGLVKRPTDRQLIARKAMVLALLRRFDEAMTLQEACGFLHVDVGQYKGIADCLLLKGKPRLAIQSFGRAAPTNPVHRSILAYAHSEAGNRAEAERLLGREWPLLRLAICVKAGEDRKAIAVAEEIVKLAAARRGRRGKSLPLKSQCGRGISLRPAYRRAIKWLFARYPEEDLRSLVHLADEDEHDKALARQYDHRPSTERIARLRARLERVPGGQQEQRVRLELSEAYAEAGRYVDAAAVLLPFAQVPGPALSYTRDTINYYAVRWSLLKRRADAEALHQKSPERLASARQVLARIAAGKALQRTMRGKPLLRMEPEARALVALGPGVLSSVMDRFKPNTIGAVDRLPLLAVVRELGEARDAPPLIHALTHITRELSENQPQNAFGQAYLDCYKGHVPEIHRCLAKMTGQPIPTGTLKERLGYWLTWWRRSASEVVSAK